MAAFTSGNTDDSFFVAFALLAASSNRSRVSPVGAMCALEAATSRNRTRSSSGDTLDRRPGPTGLFGVVPVLKGVGSGNGSPASISGVLVVGSFGKGEGSMVGSPVAKPSAVRKRRELTGKVAHAASLNAHISALYTRRTGSTSANNLQGVHVLQKSESRISEFCYRKIPNGIRKHVEMCGNCSRCPTGYQRRDLSGRL